MDMGCKPHSWKNRPCLGRAFHIHGRSFHIHHNDHTAQASLHKATGVYFVTIYSWLYSVKVISTDIYMLECPLDKVE